MPEKITLDEAAGGELLCAVDDDDDDDDDAWWRFEKVALENCESFFWDLIRARENILTVCR